MADFWDLNQLTVSFLAIPIESGYGETDAVKIKRVTADFKYKVCADGRVVRYSTNSRMCEISIKLMQTSPGNAALSLINNLDRGSPNGAGVGPLMIRNRAGLFNWLGGQCWIAGPPEEVALTAEASEWEWFIHGEEDIRFDGG